MTQAGLFYEPCTEIPILSAEKIKGRSVKQHSCHANEHGKREPLGGFQGHAHPEKILTYVPLGCHFLHFEITVNRK